MPKISPLSWFWKTTSGRITGTAAAGIAAGAGVWHLDERADEAEKRALLAQKEAVVYQLSEADMREMGLERQLTAVRQDKAALMEELAMSNAAVSRLTDQVDGLHQQVTAHEKEVDELETTVNGQGEVVAGLQKTVTTQGEDVDELQRTTTANGTELGNLKTTVTAHRREVDGIKNTVTKQGEATDVLQATLATQGEAVNELQAAQINIPELNKKIALSTVTMDVKWEAEKANKADPKKPIKVKRSGTGSGVIFAMSADKKEALILTNYHVAGPTKIVDVEREVTPVGVIMKRSILEGKTTSIEVALANGEKVKGEIYYATDDKGGKELAGNESEDLLIIKVTSPKPLTGVVPATFNTNDIEPGAFSLASGNPIGIGKSPSVGVAKTYVDVEKVEDPNNPSRLSLNTRPGKFDETVRLLAVDLSIVPGNSGGPVVDEDGYVTGISTITTGSFGLAAPGKTCADFVGRYYLGETSPEGLYAVKPVSLDKPLVVASKPTLVESLLGIFKIP